MIENELLSETIELARLELLVLALPQVEPFRSAIGERRERQALLVRWHDSQGKWGIGECSCRPDPYFNGEFLEGALSLIRHFIFPALPGRGQLRQVVQALNRIRGWPFTTAAVLEAVLDWRRRRGQPDALDRRPGPRSRRIPVGISLGLFPDADSAVTRVEEALAAGYRRIKLKV
ncbi:MAG: o-succinylbenzoate synthase, partial [Calditrichaeota bacterium]